MRNPAPMAIAAIPLLLWCGAALAQEGEGAPSGGVDRPVPFKPFPLVLDVPKDDPNAQPSARIEIGVPANGQVFLWAVSTETPAHDLTIEVFGAADKSIATDDDSGGRPTPFVQLPAVSMDRRCSVVVRSKGASGTANLMGTIVLETSESRTLAIEIRRRTKSIAEMADSGELGDARRAARNLVELLPAAETPLLSLPSVPSHLADKAVFDAASEFGQLEFFEEAKLLLGATLRFRERVLPPDHVDLQSTRSDLGVVFGALGDLNAARRLQKTALEAFGRTLSSDHAALQMARSNLAVTLCRLGDYQAARELFAEVYRIYERTLPADDSDLQRARIDLATALFHLREFEEAKKLESLALEISERTRPVDDPEIQRIRTDLAGTLDALGDLVGAKRLYELVHMSRQRTLPAEHLELQAARYNLARTLSALGELAVARRLLEQVVEVNERALPAAHPHLQWARAELANAMRALGDPAGAKILQEVLIETYERDLPVNDSALRAARINLAATLHDIGDYKAAKELLDVVIRDCEDTLSPDHPDLQVARENLAVNLFAIGDLAGATHLFETAAEAVARTWGADHPAVIAAQHRLGVGLFVLGNLVRARRLQEAVLSARLRTLHEKHPDIQSARLNLSATLLEFGDLVGARRLTEAALRICERTLPQGNPILRAARGTMANCLFALGDMEGAKKLQEAELEFLEHALSSDHGDLLRARANLATTYRALGDLKGAKRTQEMVLEVRERTLPAGHPDLLRARGNLAAILLDMGDLLGAKALQEAELEGYGRDSPIDHPGLLRAQQNLAATLSMLGEAPYACELTVAYLRGTRRKISSASEFSPRSSDIRALQHAVTLARSHDDDDAIRQSLWVSMIEEHRALPLRRAQLNGRIRRLEVKSDPDKRQIVWSWRRASREAIARATSHDVTAAAASEAFGRREEAWAALSKAIEGLGESVRGQYCDLNAIQSGLKVDEIAVGYWRYARRPSTSQGASKSEIRDLAYVIGPSTPLTVVELGPARALDRLVSAWNTSIARGSSGGAKQLSDIGEALRAHLVDPVLAVPRLDDSTQRTSTRVRRIFLTPSAAVAVLPLEVLPMADGRPLGDSIRVETITSWIELQDDGEAAAADENLSAALLAMGGIDYDGEPIPFEELLEEREDADDALAAGDGVLPDTVITGVSEDRGSWESEFDELPQSEAEVEAIASSFRDAFGKQAKRDLLLADEASKEAFMKLGPSASVLHLATHGYFAPESITSTHDPRPEHLEQMVMFQSKRQLVTGLAPSLLCGLVFAGANLGPEKVDGILTAEELMHVDLRNCELAVLSACETNVGIERAGLMIGTLRDALHAAGVRRAITSLWRVDDEAARIMMTEFYRLHWAEKMPVSEALWAAKMHLRGMKNEDGTPRFRLKNWAGFVVSGVPRRR